MKDKIYTRLAVMGTLQPLITFQAPSSRVGSWASMWLNEYNKDEFDDWNNDDEEIYDVFREWYPYAGEGEEMEVVVDYDELQKLVDKFLDVSLLYPQLIEFREDFDEWKNIDKFVRYAGCVFRNEGLVAFPLFLSYISYFNDKDYSDLVGDDLKAIKPLEPDFCVKEFITNVYLLISHNIHPYFIDYSRDWAIEILYNILESANHNKCLDKYLNLADKSIFFDLMGEVERDYNKDYVLTRIQELRDKLKDER